jgi:hypothetical protein
MLSDVEDMHLACISPRWWMSVETAASTRVCGVLFPKKSAYTCANVHIAAPWQQTAEPPGRNVFTCCCLSLWRGPALLDCAVVG